MRILLIEDEKNLSAAVCRLLQSPLAADHRHLLLPTDLRLDRLLAQK